MATILVIGASRGIGLETVKAGLEVGHAVRALARSARRIPVDHPKLEKMAGDALEMATVKRALTGVDVVTQSLGLSAGPEIILKPTRFFSDATRVLVTAMEEVQVKRLICVTGFGAGDSRSRGGFLYSLAFHLSSGVATSSAKFLHSTATRRHSSVYFWTRFDSDTALLLTGGEHLHLSVVGGANRRCR